MIGQLLGLGGFLLFCACAVLMMRLFHKVLGLDD